MLIGFKDILSQAFYLSAIGTAQDFIFKHGIVPKESPKLNKGL